MTRHSTRNTNASTRDADVARRRLLGLATLVLTLGAAHALAQREALPSAPMHLAANADAAEDVDDEPALRPKPTTAEIMAHIEAVSTRYDVPPRLVAAIVAVESRFDPRAVSRRGAQGLMQLMPATAASLDVQDSFDSEENLDGGVRHLRVLMERFHDDLPLVLAAYNAGEGAVLAYGGVPPYPQTRRYVLRVLRRYDPAAARAAAARIYGPGSPPTPAASLPVVALDWPPPPPRPMMLSRWRDPAAPRADDTPLGTPNSP